MRNILKKSKKINKLGNLNKITSTFASLSKNGFNKNNNNTDFNKTRTYCSTKTAVFGTVFKFLQSQLLEFHLAFQKQNL